MPNSLHHGKYIHTCSLFLFSYREWINHDHVSLSLCSETSSL
jgi:hypothetical protein